MRAISNIPIIMLTALGDDEDRIRGLEAGADDYVAKPSVARELSLRIRAVLKRAAGALTGDSREGSLLSAGPLQISPDGWRVTVNGKLLPLTDTELRVLSALVERQGMVVTRQYLSQYAIGRELTPYERTLDTHISNLRRKISDTGDSSCTIRAIRGSGYRCGRPVLRRGCRSDGLK